MGHGFGESLSQLLCGGVLAHEECVETCVSSGQPAEDEGGHQMECGIVDLSGHTQYTTN